MKNKIGPNTLPYFSMTWKYTKILMYDLFIFYRKLIDAVKDEIYGERRQKIKERQEKIKIKEHHKRILDLNLPTEVVSTDDEEVVVTKTDGGSQIMKLPLLHSTSQHSLLSSASKVTTTTKPSKKSSTLKKSTGISYCAPLGGDTKTVKRRKKKRGLKKPPTVKSWISQGEH
jgi:hypothetical protein